MTLLRGRVEHLVFLHVDAIRSLIPENAASTLIASSSSVPAPSFIREEKTHQLCCFRCPHVKLCDVAGFSLSHESPHVSYLKESLTYLMFAVSLRTH